MTNKDFFLALDALEQEKGISKEYLKNRENSGVIHNEAEYDYVIVNDYDMQNLNAKAEEICNNLKDN